MTELPPLPSAGSPPAPDLVQRLPEALDDYASLQAEDAAGLGL